VRANAHVWRPGSVGDPVNSGIVTESSAAIPSRRNTLPTVAMRMATSPRKVWWSTYSTSSSNFRSQVRALRPEIWASPVRPGRTSWRRACSVEEDAAQARQPVRVVDQAALGVRVEHGAELDHLERLGVQAGSLLAEEHRRAQATTDEQGDDALDGQAHHENGQGQEQVEHTLVIHRSPALFFRFDRGEYMHRSPTHPDRRFEPAVVGK
jgi:hypothetical protein